jgi:hypothetical protein
MTPAAKLFQFRHLGALHAGRRAQAATIPPVKVLPAAAPIIFICFASWVILSLYRDDLNVAKVHI